MFIILSSFHRKITDKLEDRLKNLYENYDSYKLNLYF